MNEKQYTILLGFGVIVSVVMIGAGFIMLGQNNSVPGANASATIYEIRVPESYGKTVSVSVSTGPRLVILFENGVYYSTQFWASDSWAIVWETS